MSQFAPRIKSALICLILAAFGYFSAWLVLGSAILPSSPLFTLILLYVLALLFGIVCSRWFGLPGLCGQLVAGLLLSNGLRLTVTPSWSSVIRRLSLAIILPRAGLGLDIMVLRKTPASILLLAFSPAAVENITAAVLSVALLQYSWVWAFLVGFGLSSISPAVIVPTILKLQAEGYGKLAGVPTVILAACGLDNVISLVGFTVLADIVANTSQSILMESLSAPLQIIVGSLLGILLGVGLNFFLDKVGTGDYFQLMSSPRQFEFTTLFLLICSSVILGSAKLSFPAAGALAVMVFGGVIATIFHSKGNHCQNNLNRLKDNLKWIWIYVVEPLLFGLIGLAIGFRLLDGRSLGFGALIIVIALLPRLLFAYISVIPTKMNAYERLFVSIAWIPKATVQAAIGSLVLDLLMANGSPAEEDIKRAYELLSILVLSIFMTAPLGAILIKYTGKRLLSFESESADAVPSVTTANQEQPTELIQVDVSK